MHLLLHETWTHRMDWKMDGEPQTEQARKPGVVKWRYSQRGRKSSADKAAVLADYRAGMKVKNIVAKHGCSSDTVCRWAYAAGIARYERRADG